MPIVTTTAFNLSFASTAWDPVGTKTSNNLTLSNGDRTISLNNIASNRSAKTVNGVSTGKYYWEITIGNFPASGSVERKIYIGYGDFAQPFDPGFAGDAAVGGAYAVWRGPVVVNVVREDGSSTGATPPVFVPTDIVSVALDMDNKKAWFAHNGTYIGASPPGGAGDTTWVGTPTLYAMAGIASASTTIDITANFGDSAFTYSPPSGFTGFPA